MRYFCEKEVLIFAPTGDIKTESQQVELYLANNQLYNHGMVTINHQPTSRKVINLQIGDLVQIEGYQFVIKEDQILEFVAQELGEIEGLIAIDNLIQAYPDYPEYTNSPRIKYDISDEKVELERIPEKNKDTSKANLMKKLIPALVGIIVAILMLWVRPRGIRGILMLITTFVAFAISLINLYTDRRENRIHNANRHDIYSKYLAEKREELASLKLRELASFNHNFLSMSEMIAEIKNCTYRLFERDIKDEDFLKLRLGTYEAEPTYQLNNPFEKLELRYEEADEELRELYEEYEQIKHVPLLTDVKHNTGLVGNRYVISEQLKNILMQLIFSHSYLDLKIVVITNEDFVDDYKYAFKMKHFSDNDNHHKIFITNAKERDQFLGAYTQVLRSRKQVYKPGMIFDQHYLFIIDNPSLVNNHPIMEFFESDELSLMFSIIQIAKTRNELPKYIRTVIDYRTYEQAYLELENGKVRNLDFSLPHICESNDELEAIYLRLCNLEHIKGIKSSIPDQLGFLEMYDVKSPSELNINERWQANHAYKSLAALMGKKSETDYLYMDLHEKVHGPHGLVAGTTGSGKSEVIQTYILSLALNFSPEQVGFLLIDYKGGGMANLFKDMPHHLGSITNLDGYQSMRALMSIKSELKRRQQIFADVNVNHINSYQKLFEQGKVSEALPHLFLISDEFAELKAEQPDFMKELVSAARIGRSLGIHLILATQKPDGVVDDQIWSNSKFKLSLKVAEEADSKALLKTSDAAYITNPGRGYLKVGNNELYELFQSGYSGAELSTSETKKINREIYQVDDHGVRELLNPEECVDEVDETQESLTELDAVLNEITAVYNRNKLVPVKKPWLAPLADYLMVNYTKVPNAISIDLDVKLGMVDLPSQQAQIEYLYNVMKKGNLALIGDSGMGKSQTLISIVMQLAYKNSSNLLKYFIFDFGNNGLITLKDLNQTSEYFNKNDDEKILVYREYMISEMNRRRQIMAKSKSSSFKQHNSVSSDQLQAIMIVIDDYAVVYEYDDDIQEIFKLISREGPALGIYTVASATKIGDLKVKVLPGFTEFIFLFGTEKSEINQKLKKTDNIAQEKAGNALVLLDEVEVMQLYAPIQKDEADNQSKVISKLIEECNAQSKERNIGFAKMPDALKYQLPELPENKIYLGKAFSNLKAIVIPIETQHISGRNQSGKTNLLKLEIEQIIKKHRITILDDTSYTLLEYSEYPQVTYLTDPEMIDFNTKCLFINKLSRIDKVPRKEQVKLLERLFLMHLNGTKFIVETDSKGTGNRKEDFYTMLKTCQYYIYFDNPGEQSIYPVDKKKYAKDEMYIGDAYILKNDKVVKIRIPKTITGNEGKDYQIPELKNLKEMDKLLLKSTAVLGENSKKYIEKIITDNQQEQIYLYDPNNEITTLENVQKIDIVNEEVNENISNLIINGIIELNKLSATERRIVQEKIEKSNIKKLITVYPESSKFKVEIMKSYKREKKFICTETINENIEKIFKISNRKAKDIQVNDGEAIEINGKEVKKLKINKE